MTAVSPSRTSSPERFSLTSLNKPADFPYLLIVEVSALRKPERWLPPSTVLEVGGHTDSDGKDADNQTLSENRAKSVREALINFGVRPEALQMKGYGEGSPKTTNNTEEGKFFNRRIEYSVIKN